ncbi:unannotated protein [freshwater metagenome]|uniref:Unannotated protein n=1 Tax=freshwater metagenome TaxID=449393 RepID=A0A6J7ARF4_9ZZZZ
MCETTAAGVRVAERQQSAIVIDRVEREASPVDALRDRKH